MTSTLDRVLIARIDDTATIVSAAFIITIKIINIITIIVIKLIKTTTIIVLIIIIIP